MTARRTVLFVCRHGSAKSILAAAMFRSVAAERGMAMDAMAAGIDPDPRVAPILVDALPDLRLAEERPRSVTTADLASASRVITFNLEPDELPIPTQTVERWDDIPSVNTNLEAARGAIRRHLDRLIDGDSSPQAD